ncbi:MULTISPECIES: hypothetical protein, partial [Enterobacteriaceae]|uniref:hypothetical protein n=1 Tax=Enterobacteriaceae TaxID=543 RepID=UPI001F4B19EA
ILRGVRQQQDEPGRFSICSRQAAVVLFVSQKDTGVLATFVLDKNAGDIDCSRPAMIVHYSKGVPTDWRCPTSIMLMAYSSYPFLPWPEYSHGTSQSLTVVIDTFMENAVNLSQK